MESTRPTELVDGIHSRRKTQFGATPPFTLDSSLTLLALDVKIPPTKENTLSTWSCLGECPKVRDHRGGDGTITLLPAPHVQASPPLGSSTVAIRPNFERLEAEIKIKEGRYFVKCVLGQSVAFLKVLQSEDYLIRKGDR